MAPAPASHAPAAAPTSAADPAWTLYHQAFLDSVLMRPERSKAALQRILADYPGHPAALFAQDMLHTMEAPEAQPRVAEDDERYGTLRPTGLARAELTSFQTLAGIGAAGMLCGLAECDDGRVIVVVLAVGAGAGLAGSLLGTRKGITPGRALAINSGTMWGVWNGVAVSVVADANDKGTFGAILAGQVLGTLGGAVVGAFANPTAGDVSLATSGGLWLGGLMFMIHAVSDFAADGKVVMLTTMLASDAGLVGGALLSALDIYPMSRSRALLIDSGGILGTLVGMGLSVLVKNEVDNAPAFFGPALAGMLVGLSSATYLTRNWDAPELEADVAVGIGPVEGGGATLMVGGRF
ncbi:MAG: hypothetical protein H6730_14775 [Deltaproteobacteria bacterium]|nr:hypothetical protein [Deltaproteobacteria bacterium]